MRPASNRLWYQIFIPVFRVGTGRSYKLPSAQPGRREMAKIQLRNIDHLVLRVRDIDAMRKFYCDVLGAEHIAYRPKFAMSHLRVGECMLDLVEAGKRGVAVPGAGGALNLDHF